MFFIAPLNCCKTLTGSRHLAIEHPSFQLIIFIYPQTLSKILYEDCYEVLKQK